MRLILPLTNVKSGMRRPNRGELEPFSVPQKFLRFELSSRLDIGSLTFCELVNHLRLMSADFPVVMTYFIQELVDSSE
jgi:hypothetical protein